MAPTPSVSTWKRPYTSIYNDNYKYGTGLYNDTLTDIEKRYSDSLGRTHLRSDRPDIGFATFAGSSLGSSPAPAGGAGDEGRVAFKRQVSSSALDTIDELMKDTKVSMSNRMKEAMKEIDDRSTRHKTLSPEGRPKSLYDDSAFWSSPKLPNREELDLENMMSKRTTSNGPTASQWREKSRLLQEQVESLENNMSNCGSRLQSELSALKSKYQAEVSDLGRTVELTSQQANELMKLCKRQAQQIMELESAYENSQRNVSDALDEVSLWQNKCNSIKKEMNRLREDIELTIQRRSKD